MKRLHEKDIVLGRVYYSVCCGDISPIIFTNKSPSKGDLTYIEDEFKTDHTWSDLGVDCDMSTKYENDLNIVVSTFNEAADIVNDTDYKRLLEEHQENCDFFNDYEYDEEYL